MCLCATVAQNSSTSTFFVQNDPALMVFGKESCTSHGQWQTLQTVSVVEIPMPNGSIAFGLYSETCVGRPHSVKSPCLDRQLDLFVISGNFLLPLESLQIEPVWKDHVSWKATVFRHQGYCFQAGFTEYDVLRFMSNREVAPSCEIL